MKHILAQNAKQIGPNHYIFLLEKKLKIIFIYFNNLINVSRLNLSTDALFLFFLHCTLLLT